MRATKMEEKSKRNLIGICLMAIGIFAISVSDAGSKFLVEADYHPFQLMALSAWMMVLVLILWSIFDRKQKAIGIRTFKTTHLYWHIIRSVLSIIAGILFLYFLKFFKLTDVTIIYFFAPVLMTAMSAIFLKEKVGLFRCSAVVFGFFGVVIALKPTVGVFDWMMLLPLAGSLAYAIRAVLVRRMAGVESATQIVFHTRLGVAILASLPLVLFWKPMALSDFSLLVALTALGLIYQLLVTKATVTASLIIVGPFEYTALIWTVLLGYIIWGDLPTTNMWIGAFFIIGAGFTMTYREAVLKRDQVVTPINVKG